MCMNKMMYKVVNVSISRAISERITNRDCVTNERRLRDFSAKSGGDRLKFPWAPAAQTKRFHFNSNPPGVNKLEIKQTKP